MSDLLNMNGFVLLGNFILILRMFFKGNFMKYLITILKYALYAYGLYLVKGYVGTLFYLMFIPIFLYQKFKMQKNIFIKLLLTAPVIYFMYITGVKDVFNILPFVAAFIEIWLVPVLINNKKAISRSIRCILLMIYFYHNNLILLFILETLDLAFIYGYIFIEKIVKFSNTETSIIGKL